jgi:hypothetical protein
VPGVFKVAVGLSAVVVAASALWYWGGKSGDDDWFVDQHWVAVAFGVIFLTAIWIVALLVYSIESYSRNRQD